MNTGTRYCVKIEEIPDSLGGGYKACIPELGAYMVVGDGETVQAAYDACLDCLEGFVQEGIIPRDLKVLDKS